MSFTISDFHGSTIWKLYRIRDRIQLDPEYQRLGGIWAPENRQLLVDTVLNGFDVPKLYMHKFSKPSQKNGKIFDFAIVDGRQRLETMWNFIGGHVALANDFKLFRDPEVAAGGMTYQELGTHYPELKADFDGFPLSVVLIETDDLEMIEEMFSRLNEAVPLNAAEKRNAFGGPVPVAIRKLAKEAFFTECLPFPNQRYRHFDLAAKFLSSEYQGKVVDTKKVHLDAFVDSFSLQPRAKALPFAKRASQTITIMRTTFSDGDPLLRQVGMINLYYQLFRHAGKEGWQDQISRKKLVDFEKTRQKNRQLFETGQDDKSDRELIEFDDLAQSLNDSSAIRFRLRVLADRAFHKKLTGDDF